ncbi:ParA family protein [Phytohabitans aurantiacus]|uniref:Chromosome partitioning ATPase n=1 Tax=Phytohabitans aurantiacus TaxID=3016789 RepID=A0ABQ5R3Y9_9ACTN|nr:ParA family protein [Phytohabitans aurantiacus]GLI00892.1 hypothetical protein Pa4123_61680 [Phytohabitans aurantiacus]
MALIALCSAKGSPGATVTALACTLTWTRRTILAECDPAGGDLAAGYLREVRLDGRGLAQLTASMHRRRLGEDLWGQLVDLAPGEGSAMTRLALPGLTDPAQAGGLVAGWAQLAHLFRSLETGATGYDVIADCGRLVAAHPPTPLLAAADAVLLVLRPTLPSIRASATALAGLARLGAGPVGLVTVGDGSYPARELASELRTPLVAGLPDDPGTAVVLSNGGERHRGRLLRAASQMESPVWRMVNAGRVTRKASGGVGEVVEVRSVH